MSYLGKVFKFQKHENFEGFIKSLGLSEEQSARYSEHKPSLKLVKNGDTYTLSIISSHVTKDLTFKLGVEFEEQVRDNVKAKNVFTLEGNTLNQVQKYDAQGGRTFNYKRVFSDNQVVETITTSFWDGSAVIYYSV